MNVTEEELYDFPIQFKEINYSDFPEFEAVDEEKK